MIGAKFVGFLALIGGVAVLLGNFVQQLNEKYYLIPIGAVVAVLAGLIGLLSRKY